MVVRYMLEPLKCNCRCYVGVIWGPSRRGYTHLTWGERRRHTEVAMHTSPGERDVDTQREREKMILIHIVLQLLYIELFLPKTTLNNIQV